MEATKKRKSTLEFWIKMPVTAIIAWVGARFLSPAMGPEAAPMIAVLNLAVVAVLVHLVETAREVVQTAATAPARERVTDTSLTELRTAIFDGDHTNVFSSLTFQSGAMGLIVASVRGVLYERGLDFYTWAFLVNGIVLILISVDLVFVFRRMMRPTISPIIVLQARFFSWFFWIPVCTMLLMCGRWIVSAILLGHIREP